MNCYKVLQLRYLRESYIAWKVSVFGVILVRIFPHSDWISLRIHSECGKVRTRITPNKDTFYKALATNLGCSAYPDIHWNGLNYNSVSSTRMVLHVYSTLKRKENGCFNVEYTWCAITFRQSKKTLICCFVWKLTVLLPFRNVELVFKKIPKNQLPFWMGFYHCWIFVLVRFPWCGCISLWYLIFYLRRIKEKRDKEVSI